MKQFFYIKNAHIHLNNGKCITFLKILKQIYLQKFKCKTVFVLEKKRQSLILIQSLYLYIELRRTLTQYIKALFQMKIIIVLIIIKREKCIIYKTCVS